MCDTTCLQIDEDIALQLDVVEHEVDEEISCVGLNVLLPCNKCVPFAKLQQELVEVCNNRPLEFAFVKTGVLGNAKKLGDERILDVFELVSLKADVRSCISASTELRCPACVSNSLS